MNIRRLVLLIAGFTASLFADQSATIQAIENGRRMSAEDATRLESVLQSDSENAEARAQLLGYYWMKTGATLRADGQLEDPQASAPAREARLRHVLWVAEHHPEWDLAERPEMWMLVRAPGQVSPDYEQVKAVWLRQAEAFPQSAPIQKHAALALMPDREIGMRVMKRALELQSEDKELARHYGMMLAGSLISGRVSDGAAADARRELEACSIAAMCGSAGGMLSQFGRMRNRPEFRDLASALLRKAQALEPTNPAWTNQLQQVYKPVTQPGLMPQSTEGGVIAGIIGAVPSAPPPPPPPPGWPQDGVKAIRVGGNVQAANLVRQPRPVYPALAKEARIQGTVRFNATIGRDGTIENLQLISGHPLMVQAAQEAVRQWVYKPTLLNGEPVRVITTIDVNFTLADEPAQP